MGEWLEAWMGVCCFSGGLREGLFGVFGANIIKVSGMGRQSAMNGLDILYGMRICVVCKVVMAMKYDLSSVGTRLIRHRLAFEEYEYDQFYDSLDSCIACSLGNLKGNRPELVVWTLRFVPWAGFLYPTSCFLGSKRTKILTPLTKRQSFQHRVDP